MKVGTRVKVKGLVKAAQHNGKIGKVVKSIAADGRVGIQLSDGKQLASPRRSSASAMKSGRAGGGTGQATLGIMK